LAKERLFLASFHSNNTIRTRDNVPVINLPTLIWNSEEIVTLK